jgi:hypothetical protein
MARIRDIAEVCKSKNAGPFDLAIDVLFGNDDLFRRVQHRRSLCGAVRPTLRLWRPATCFAS